MPRNRQSQGRIGRAAMGSGAASWAHCCLLASCLPTEDLSSYSAGRGRDASVIEEPLTPDAGSASLPQTDLGDASLEAGTAGPGAGPQPLACRAGCECELRAGRDFMLCPGATVARSAAEQDCIALGGSLVSVESDELNQWLTERMTQQDQSNYWTGGSDEASEGIWRWSDGRVFFEVGDAAAAPGFTAWAMNQPNGGGMENCLRSIDGLWRDLDCGDLAAYACQR
jgi:hypothetical protein